jgi:uridine phosphorylase
LNTQTNYNDVVISPQRLSGEKIIPKYGILAVNPTDMNRFAGNAKKMGYRRQSLFHAHLFLKDDHFVAGPCVGAPMAVMALEKLIALGANTIILYGWCGSLQTSLQVGDILLPTGFLSEEGCSPHYPLAAKPDMEPKLLEELQNTLQDTYRVHQGKIWTTDAPYRETRDKVDRFSQQGIMAVDMECSALCTVAAFRGVRFAAVLFVSDELYHPQWRPRFHHKTFLQSSSDLLLTLCTFAFKGA